MMKQKVIFLAVTLGTLVAIAPALAVESAGLAMTAAQLGPADRAALQHAVMADRLARPAAYDLVAAARGCRPDGWKVARNPTPVCSREMRALGPAGLLPMLSALALDWQPDASRLSSAPELRSKEEQAMLVAMVDAVGILRDTRARPVLLALWKLAADRREVQLPIERANSVSRVVAEALGRLGGAVELQALQAHLRAEDPLYNAAIAGLGWCKRTDSAQLLVSALAGAKDDATQRWIVAAMGDAGFQLVVAGAGQSARAGRPAGAPARDRRPPAAAGQDPGRDARAGCRIPAAGRSARPAGAVGDGPRNRGCDTPARHRRSAGPLCPGARRPLAADETAARPGFSAFGA